MDISKITTLGELKKSGYISRSIKDELRENLIQKIQNNTPVFKGIIGYDNTVIPQIERAILAKHNINLLGLRGQAKTRIARQMVELLDEWTPIIKGSEINEDPLNPISRLRKELVAEKGDKLEIEWLHRNDRFAEKLATPDVSVADIIGDVDPIKAANLKLSYADDRVIHYGMIPRANRSIFVINELPDLQARIQVALFNILQEGDIQIRGFKLRLPLDMQFVFTANPEDYTNRGSIVTPLKDRIGSQIMTHYPESIDTAKQITSQETSHLTELYPNVQMPELAKDLLEQISFEARVSPLIDSKSGVSARLSITAFENLLSTCELRRLQNNAKSSQVRLSDFVGILPAINGKVELVYEGEQEGAEKVGLELIESAVKTIFNKMFPEIKKLERPDEVSPYQDVYDWFYETLDFELLDDASEKEYEDTLNSVKPLDDLIKRYQPNLPEDNKLFVKELLLWGLAANNKLSKSRFTEGYQFKDLFGSYVNGIGKN